ncbi:MAG TPA: hypothetical protein VMU06_13795 [Stellaceae bacterium]|nr:hypothetical protein [Stellaceae bacterium]
MSDQLALGSEFNDSGMGKPQFHDPEAMRDQIALAQKAIANVIGDPIELFAQDWARLHEEGAEQVHFGLHLQLGRYDATKVVSESGGLPASGLDHPFQGGPLGDYMANGHCVVYPN